MSYPRGKSSPDALQIKIASDMVVKGGKILRKLYSTKNKEKKYPLGIKMRLVPDRKRLVSSRAKGKLQDALVKQLAFIQKIF